MAKNFYDITLALAGICQSSQLVQQLAYQGHCPSDPLKTMLNSLMDLNPSSTLSVFGNDESNLQFGLDTLLVVLNSNSWQDIGAELMHYTLSMMVLERKLNASKKALRELAERIAYLDRQLAYYDLESDTLLSAIAGIYMDTISPLGPRIQVTGSPSVLQNAQVQSKIRVTLLAGIRAAVLWQQVGGSRLQLMFSRNRLANEAKTIFSRFSSEPSSN